MAPLTRLIRLDVENTRFTHTMLRYVTHLMNLEHFASFGNEVTVDDLHALPEFQGRELNRPCESPTLESAVWRW